MFESAKGFFHFCLANPDDDFYTPSYVKMKFIPFLRYTMIEAQYRYIYIFGRGRVDSKNDYWLDAVGQSSVEALRQPIKSRRIISRAIKLVKSRESSEEVSKKYTIERTDFKSDDLDDIFLSVLEIINRKYNSAVAIPASILNEFSDKEEIMKKLAYLRNKKKSSIMIITEGVNSDVLDLYFKSNQNDLQNTCIFSNPDVFPEIAAVFNAPPEEKKKLTFTYDLLNDGFSGRFNVLNALEYDDILNLTNYSFLRSTDSVCEFSADGCAAVITAWYRCSQFRQRYESLRLPQNPSRKTKEVAAYLSDKKNIRLINEVALNECADNTDAFFDKWQPDEDTVAVHIENRSLPEIVNLMKAYRQAATAHGLLNSKDHRTLTDMIITFSKPAYVPAENWGILPHFLLEKNSENNCYSQINGFICELKSKEENVNDWDKAAANILFFMFTICRAAACSPCNIDNCSQLSGAKFEKCRQAIAICRKQSRETTNEDYRASLFEKRCIDFMSQCAKSSDVKTFFPEYELDNL